MYDDTKILFGPVAEREIEREREREKTGNTHRYIYIYGGSSLEFPLQYQATAVLIYLGKRLNSEGDYSGSFCAC